ncbi:MAG: hypothetical protein HN576_02590 [Bacteriovoracaceae bacterium]|jgi:hypothetical protein|nr:hypothetical protein [Bacteriovoracaceae bacterium]
MKLLLLVLIYALLAASCSDKATVSPIDSRREQITPDPNQDGTDVSPDGTDLNPIFQTLEFKASLKSLKSAKLNLTLQGHLLPMGLIDLGVENINWIFHDIKVETTLNEYKWIPWTPGYVISHYQNPDPITGVSIDAVYKFLDNDSFDKINDHLNNFLNRAESFYNSYKDEIGESDKKLLELQYSLVENTQANYENHLADLNERSKIRTMTWSKILEEFPMSDLVYCDESLDLIYIAGLIVSGEDEILGPLVQDDKVILLENEKPTLYPESRIFKVYTNFLTYIKN